MGGIVFIFLIVIGFIIFCIYFSFKAIQFTIQAINYYKKILIREDVIIKLLVDIRDNTKLTLTDIDFDSDKEETGKFCPHCNRPDVFFDANGNLFCPHCKKVIDPAEILRAPAPLPGNLPGSAPKEPYPGNTCRLFQRGT